MCSIYNNWESVTRKYPEAQVRVLVVVESPRNKYRITTIAQYVPKHTVLAEDFLDPDCDSDFCDEGPDGREYAPEGWYEWTTESDEQLMLSGRVHYWARLPEKPNDWY
jgi:hypothetical protein